MHRDSLIEFIKSVKQGKPRLAFENTLNILRTQIAAVDSLEKNGKTVQVK